MNKESVPFGWADSLSIYYSVRLDVAGLLCFHTSRMIPSELYAELMKGSLHVMMAHEVIQSRIEEVDQKLLDIDLKTHQGERVAKECLANMIVNHLVDEALNAKAFQKA